MKQCPQCINGYCPACIKKLMASADEAETYVRRLKSGDRSVQPLNNNHRKLKTDAIRKTLSGSSPDCSYSKRK